MRINECVTGLCDSGPCCRANPPLSRWSPGQGAGRIEIQMAVAPRCSTYRSMSNSQISVLDLRFAPIPVSLEPVLIIEQHPDITTRKHAVSCGLLMMALEPFELRGPSAGRYLRVPRSRRTSRLTADPRQPRRVDTGPAPNAGSPPSSVSFFGHSQSRWSVSDPLRCAKSAPRRFRHAAHGR